MGWESTPVTEMVIGDLIWLIIIAGIAYVVANWLVE